VSKRSIKRVSIATHTREHLFPCANTVGRDNPLGDRSIEAGCALEGRAAGIIKEFGAVPSVAFSVSLGGIEKHGKARAIKLFNQFPQVLGRRSSNIA